MKAEPMFKKIAIIGVGLIGGSIGLVARKKGLASETIGVFRRQVSLKNALKMKAVDKGTMDIQEAVSGADLIVVSTPVNKVKQKIREAANRAKKSAIIIDVNSVKEDVVRYADKIMPAGVYFVGTHPVAGSEETGVLSANADMFRDSVCIITPTRHTAKPALKKVIRFWAKLGSKVKVSSPASHDKVTANISHLPHLLAYSICHAVPIEDMKSSGPGMKDTTRIAKSNPRMWAEIFLENKHHLLKSIECFQRDITSLKKDIRGSNKKALLAKLASAQRKRNSIS
jgi:prephenate dehydrogenase